MLSNYTKLNNGIIKQVNINNSKIIKLQNKNKKLLDNII